jgi:DNA polymerase-3 subunit gamma/tau
MSYLVLARKYRPRTFAEVAGQEVITRTLQGAIREGRVGHAYLFTGPRGTGKTTSARVFAKALNCEQGPTIDPCGVCERCTSIDSGSDVDVVEIDAASNTGVDNIRDLREQAAYTPMRARFKVFIVDEVHMLSKGAFNALLKTLEEPPPHVKFLFATTELAKVPDTILSRCQVLRLSLFSEELIARRLSQIFEAEGVQAAAGVAEGLARLARGSMRDALSITDQLLAQAGAQPTVEDVARLSGANAAGDASRLLDALVARDTAAALEILGPGEGQENEWLAALLRELRGALLVALVKDGSALTSDFAAERERLGRIASQLGPERLQAWMEDLLSARERMENAPSLARTVFELSILELCREEASMPFAQLVQRLALLEQRLGAPAAPSAAGAPSPRAPVVSGASGAHAAPAAIASAPPPSAAAGRVVELRPSAPPARQASLGAAPAVAHRAPAAAELAPVPRAAPPKAPEPAAPRPVFGGAPGAGPGARAAVGSAPGPSAPGPSGGGQRGTLGASLGLRPTWEAFLARLKTEDGNLAGILERRGTPHDFGAGRAHVQLRGLRADERGLLQDPAQRERCERILGGLLGQSTALVFEDVAQQRPGDQDPFTRSVAELFGGRIEDKT